MIQYLHALQMMITVRPVASRHHTWLQNTSVTTLPRPRHGGAEARPGAPPYSLALESTSSQAAYQHLLLTCQPEPPQTLLER